MAVSNSLAKKKTQMFVNSQTAAYEVGGQLIELTPEIVREYMVSGDKTKVTTQEVVMFMNLCKFSGLNPWAKEAYCIKYGNEPATMVVGKEAYMKRAESNEAYDGIEAGIIVLSPEDHEIIRRPGGFKLPKEEIIGGWAKVYRKDRNHPYEVEVSFDEYAGKKKDGSLNSQWAKKPATMIRKVALVQALREAFPSSFGGAFTEEEGEYTEVPEIVIPEEEPAKIEQREPVKMPMQQTRTTEPVQTAMPAPEPGQRMDDDGQAFFA